ncbi:TAXI family TRAP transporter solute-binding subunit [Arthrobacter celericrescens]|uniref:TAXI family TRAP transporter solute-binding subunit n=1 Tax=Arthrobacter celericrescens TaxID=2320851 RepID=UPI000EA25E81|nr:TAXI family TRAP transporter solute-binding subunit [Arthrobacter celericrescens]
MAEPTTPERRADMSRRAALRTALRVGLSAGLALPALAACTPGGGLQKITVAGGESGGFYLEFATLLAGALRREGVAGEAEPLVTGGSLENLELLRAGKATFAVALADAAAQTAPAADTAEAMAAVGKVYENYVHCIVRQDNGIRSLGELAGRTVGTGETRSGTSLTARRILETFGAGAGREAFSKHPPAERSLGLNTGLAALRAGTVDALFWSGGVPTAAISALNEDLGLSFLDLSALIRPMRSRYGPFYDRVLIPQNSYAGAPGVWTVGVANLLLCRQDLGSRTVERTVELLVNHAAGLVPQTSAGVQFLSPDTLINTAGIPLHPAAERAYRRLHG